MFTVKAANHLNKDNKAFTGNIIDSEKPRTNIVMTANSINTSHTSPISSRLLTMGQKYVAQSHRNVHSKIGVNNIAS